MLGMVVREVIFGYNTRLLCNIDGRYRRESILHYAFAIESHRFLRAFLRRPGRYFDSSASRRQPIASLRQTVQMGGLALLDVLRHHLARNPLAIFAHFVELNQLRRDDRRSTNETTDIGQAILFRPRRPSRPV